MEDAERTYTVEYTEDGEVKILDFEPTPIGGKCPFETPAIDWPKSMREAPKGRLIKALYGDYGWGKGELLCEIEQIIKNAIKPLTTTHFLLSWTASFCAKLSCAECRRVEDCDTFGAQATRERGKNESDEWVMGHSDPLERRIEPYYYAWVKLKDKHLKRAIIVLAILGKNGMRRGGYFRNDIARIAGISTKNQNAIIRIIEKLTEWGFLRRQKRKTRAPRYRYRFGGSSEKIQVAADEAAKDHLKGTIIELLQEETKHEFALGKNYSDVGFGVLVGQLPPACIIETVRRLSNLSVIIFEHLLEPRLLSRMENNHWKGKKQDDGALERLLKEIHDLMSYCDSIPAKDAEEWEEFRARTSSNETGRGPVLVYDIPWLLHCVSQ